MVNFMKIVKFY